MKTESICFFDVITPNGPAGMMLGLKESTIDSMIATIQHTANNLMEGVTFQQAIVVEVHNEKIEDYYTPENIMAQHMNEDGSLTKEGGKVWFKHIMTMAASEDSTDVDEEE